MERLTRRSKANEGLPIKHLNIMHMDMTSEDTLTEILERLAYYEDLEEQRLLIKLPCKVGSTVYVLSTCDKIPTKLDGGYWDATGYYCPYEDCDDCPFAELDDCAEGIVGIFKDEFVGYSSSSYEEKLIILLNNVCDDFGIEDFGKTVFLTYEEAKEKLKEVK